MSDAKYAPYGADDDPFLTHPAGAGQARGPSPHSQYGQSSAYWDGDHGYSDHGHGDNGYTNQTAGVGYARPSHGPYADQGGSYDYAGHAYAPADYHHGYESPAPQEYPFEYAQRDRNSAAPRGNFITRQNPTPQSPAPQSYDTPPRHYDAAPMAAPAQNYAHDDHAAASYRPASFAAPPRMQPRIEPQQHAPQPQRAHLRGPVAYAPQPLQQAQDTGYFAAPQGMGLGGHAGGIMQWAGAICTVAVVIGAALWGYELAMRDANGIPVVRAAAGPLRIAPETPGGEISAHQGLAVNAIPAAGSAAPALPEQITLAPQTAALAPEDMGAAIIEDGSFAQTAGEGSAAALEGASDMARSLTETSSAPETDLTALPDALPEDMPMTDAEAVERALEAALAEGGEVATDASAAVADAAAMTPEPVSMAQTDPIAPPTAEIDPSQIALGTPMVQLGAFDSDATARAEWATLQTRFTELMAGKALVVEPAKSGGRDFFRLRAHGFDSADDTRRFCAAVLAENGSCFPVDQR